MKRECIDCGSEITSCMGFVFVGDILNKRKEGVRELCAKCGPKYLYEKDIEKVIKKLKEKHNELYPIT